MADIFPKDIWLHILNLLPNSSLLKIRATCRRLNELVIGMQERWFREYHWLCIKMRKKDQMRKFGFRTFQSPEQIPIDHSVFRPKAQYYIYSYLIESYHHWWDKSNDFDREIETAERDLRLITERLVRLREHRALIPKLPPDNNIFYGYAVNSYKRPNKVPKPGKAAND